MFYFNCDVETKIFNVERWLGWLRYEMHVNHLN